MQKSFAASLVVATLALGACSTSSLTDAEKAPVAPSSAAFSGQVKEINKESSVISFLGKSNVINHEGKFTDYTAKVTLDSAEPANLEKAKLEAEIDMTTIVVDAAGLQGHLQKDDFFATAANPKATFVSTGIVRKAGNAYAITGDLTVKGQTKSITFDADITDDYLTAHYEFPRADFGVGNNSYGAKLLEDTVPVDVKLVFQK